MGTANKWLSIDSIATISNRFDDIRSYPHEAISRPDELTREAQSV